MRPGFEWLLTGVVALACRAPGPGPGTPDESVASEPVARPAPDLRDNRDVAYALYWSGQRVGEARESLARDRFVRRERLAIRRGSAVVELGTDVEVQLGPGMAPRRVVVTRASGPQRVTGRAVLQDGRWRIVNDVADHSERPRWVDGEAIPVELIPWMVGRSARQPRQWKVLLSGHGFATADLYVRPMDTAPNTVLAMLSVPGGLLTSEIAFDDEGVPVAVASDGGLESRRVDARELYADFEPPELVDAASIAVAGKPARGNFVRLVLEDVSAPPPPSLPGQVVRAQDRTWRVTLTSGLGVVDIEAGPRAVDAVAPDMRDVARRVVADAGARSPMDEIRALADYTDRAIANDLGAASVDARGALAMGRGDCKAHASVFAQLAIARGFDVALVTGFRLVDAPARLTRHRWAMVRLGERWLAVDPTYGEVPAAPRVLGLAVHSAADDTPLTDETAFAGFARTTARIDH